MLLLADYHLSLDCLPIHPRSGLATALLRLCCSKQHSSHYGTRAAADMQDVWLAA